MTGQELIELLSKHDTSQQIEVLHKSEKSEQIFWIDKVHFTEGAGYFITVDLIETTPLRTTKR